MIVDSSILIDHLRSTDKSSTIFAGLLEEITTKPKISILSHTELFAGKSVWEHKQARLALELTLSKVIVIDLTQEISQLAGKLKATMNTPMADAIIAATALAEHEPLVTLNPKHFATIPQLKVVAL